MPMLTPRQTFLSDVITTAVEGGIGYWSQCSQYQWTDDDGTVHVVVGPKQGSETRATVHVLLDDESGYHERGLPVTLATVRRGLRLIVDGGTNVADRIVEQVRRADRNNDAGEIDADVADVIVQAGLLGEVVYG